MLPLARNLYDWAISATIAAHLDFHVTYTHMALNNVHLFFVSTLCPLRIVFCIASPLYPVAVFKTLLHSH